MTRHRKNLHGYQPRPRRYLNGRAARMSTAAPYPSTQHQGATPASMAANPMVPDLAGLVRCDALSPAESSRSGVAEFQDEFGELTWEKLFPSENLASVGEQPSRLPFPIPNSLQPSAVPFDLSNIHTPQIDPRLLSDGISQPHIPTPNSFQPSTAPADFSTHYTPQIDPRLLSDVHIDPKLLSDNNSQPPIPAFDGDIQWKPASGNDMNNSLPARLEEFLLTYGSGTF
ncbi:hypothetical protein CY34DRAFT_454652 [Suillus luteus UH-Slu-Lm8-n1]|uniref:Uncharacterized protein n=1 Tax=Suillus luteus UH-Slu-Lm8-n1 TaxID=930992 RepID=A0A0D0ATF6_9AGAM|nr:hypothetical protein CY34DRAFT_454652 [Suillus luteus UH-Slu-Lm8-n1]